MPTMEHMQDRLKGRFISGSDGNLLKIIDNIIISTGKPRVVFRQLREQNLIITSGDREELIKYLLKLVSKKKVYSDLITGFIITCGFMPNRKIRKMLEKSGIPTLIVEDDTYSVITKLDEMIVKIHPGEKKKINMIARLVRNHVDITALLAKI